jgi:hypothetical protein
VAIDEMTEDHPTLALRQFVECLAEIGEEFSVLEEFNDVSLPAINEFFSAESRSSLVTLALIKSTNDAGVEKRFDLNDPLGRGPCFRSEFLNRRSASIASRKRALNHFNSTSFSAQ